MPSIQTFTGHEFDPMQIETAPLDIVDIAHALSNICRYTGHCREFYSVAQHSLLVRGECQILGGNRETIKYALIHDAHEAYTGDVSRPMKSVLVVQVADYFDRLGDVEKNLNLAIASRLGVAMDEVDFDLVKKCDDIMLATERRDLMVPDTFDWHLTEKPRNRPVLPLPPGRSKAAFLSCFRQYFDQYFDADS